MDGTQAKEYLYSVIDNDYNSGLEWMDDLDPSLRYDPDGLEEYVIDKVTNNMYYKIDDEDYEVLAYVWLYDKDVTEYRKELAKRWVWDYPADRQQRKDAEAYEKWYERRYGC